MKRTGATAATRTARAATLSRNDRPALHTYDERISWSLLYIPLPVHDISNMIDKPHATRSLFTALRIVHASRFWTPVLDFRFNEREGLFYDSER